MSNFKNCIAAHGKQDGAVLENRECWAPRSRAPMVDIILITFLGRRIRRVFIKIVYFRIARTTTERIWTGTIGIVYENNPISRIGRAAHISKLTLFGVLRSSVGFKRPPISVLRPLENVHSAHSPVVLTRLARPNGVPVLGRFLFQFFFPAHTNLI